MRTRQRTVERLFGDGATPPAEAPAAGAGPDAAAEEDVVRRSYCILRGRIEVLPSLELRNRRGQTRLIPWHYFGGASLDHPGELVLLFDGPEGACQVTINGRSLDVELLDGVKAQRVSWIEEQGDLASAASAGRSDPVVTGIFIKGGGREWGRGAAPGR
jgi:hypothetical protein